MNKNSIIVTIKKEIRSILRDKKTLITLLIFPLLIPAMIFLYSYIYDADTQEEQYNIAIDYEIDNTVKSIIEECNLNTTYYNSLEEMEESYNNKEISGYIHYDKENNNYIIYTNEDSQEGMYTTSYITTYLETYNDYLAKIYLISEDIDVDYAYNNLSYEIEDLEGENFILEIIFSIAFTYIIMSIVLACTNMATSATAVEKENGTLETLLTFPIRANELIIGKYLASFIVGLIASIIGLILTVLSILTASNLFTMFATIPIKINILTILIGIITCVSASLFIAGISIAITSSSKTYKEAQSSSQVLSILTVIPMMISLIGIEINTTYYLIPIANYVQLLMDIFSQNFNLLNIIIVIISTIIYVIIVITFITKQYKKEKVLFGE